MVLRSVPKRWNIFGHFLGKLSVPRICPKACRVFGAEFLVKKYVIGRRRGRPKHRLDLVRLPKKGCSNPVFHFVH